MGQLKQSSTAGGGLVWTQTNLPLTPQETTLLYKGMEVVDNTNNQTVGGNKTFTGTVKINNAPVATTDGVNKAYADGLSAQAVKSVTGTDPIVATAGKTPVISIKDATPTQKGSMSAADKAKLDNHPMNVVNKDGDTMTGNLVTSGGFYADGLISSKIQVIAQDTTNTYSTRMTVSGSAGYFQAGKTDRDVADQKLILSGWLGTPLTMSKFSMANGVNPQVAWGSTNHDILHRGNMPTVADISAMGRYYRPDGDDCNNAIAPGNYGIGGFTTNTPIGSGPSGSTLLVLAWETGTVSVSQMFISYTQDRVWIRKRYTGVWQPWFELYSSASKQPVGGAGTGIGDNPNATTVTGGVRDFNLVKTNGIFTIEGSWINGITNVATGTTHNGILEVKQRSLDNLTVQRYTQHVIIDGITIENSLTRVYQNTTDGWSPWVYNGQYQSVNMYRSGVFRLNSTTGDDSNYPYTSYTKEKYRDTVAVGTGYTIGEIGFRVNPTSRHDPHSGDQLGRILGLAFNTTTTGEYDGGLFLASRLRKTDNTTADSSTLAINRLVGAEFTHAAKKVSINTGVVTAENFLQSTTQSNLVNSSTRKDYVDGEIAKQVAKTGDTMTGVLTVGAEVRSTLTNSYRLLNGTSSIYGTFWRNDGSNLYLMLTNANDALGTYNALRPFTVALNTGITTLSADSCIANSTQKIFHDKYAPRITQSEYLDTGSDLNNMAMYAGGLTISRFGSGVANRPTVVNSANTILGINPVTGYKHQLVFSSDGKMYNRYNDNVSWSNWGQVYTTIYRPTPAEVGAVNKTGDTMTGNLTTSGILRGQLYHDKGYFSIGAYGSSYGDGRLQGYFREYNNGTPGVGYLGLNIEHRDSVGAITGKQVDILLNGKFVYHEGRNPTPAAVGAVNIAGDTMTGPLTIAPTSGANAEVVLNSTTTTESSILFRNGSVTRWKFYQDNSEESGSNVGSDLLLRANADDGSSLGFVFDIQRETQIMSFVRNPRTNATQDTASNSLTRKDYVDSAIATGDALQVSKSGDTMTGNLSFSDTGEGVRFTAFNPGSGIYNGTGDGASQDATNIQIKSWQGIGISPTTGLPAGMTMGQNSIWINARTGDIDTIGSVNSNSIVSNSFKVVGSNGLVSSTNGSQGIYIGSGADTRTIVGGGSVAAGTVVIRPRGTNDTTSNTVFNNDGTITNSVAPTATGHLTNKAYVDSAITAGDALQVSKSGDTMTGTLTSTQTTGNWRIAPTTTGNYGSFWHQDTNNLYLMLTNVNSQTSSYNNLRPFRVTLSTGLVAMENGLLLTSAQGTSAESATRKDYVDGVANGRVNVNGDTMSGSLTITSPGTGLILNPSGTTSSYILGQIGGVSSWYVGKGSSSTNDITLHSYGHDTNIILQGDRVAVNKNILVSVGQSTAVNAYTRKDYVDGQVATRAPTTHNHTAAQANSNIVAGSTYVVGSYVLAQKTSGAAIGYGSNVAGSTLIPASAGNRYWDGNPLSGTWKCMGYAYDTSGEVDQRTTLFIRIS